MKKTLLLGAIALSPITLIKPAAAEPMVLQLSAANMLAQTHSHAIILNITGTYQQLAGTLNYDLAANTCHVDVTFQVNSLQLPNALVRSQTMSQGFLDPAEYPTTVFTGDCQNNGTQLVGNLTLRGQTHPFTMAISYVKSGDQVTSIHTEGSLNRYDWGLTGLTMTVGKVIRVTNDISLNGQPPAPPPAS
jgi:polyisoprenoid-binding protein YceI